MFAHRFNDATIRYRNPSWPAASSPRSTIGSPKGFGKEAEAKTLAVRKRRSQETRTLDLDSFLQELKTEIAEKSLGDIL